MTPQEILDKPPVRVRYVGPLVDPFFKSEFMVSYQSSEWGVRGFTAFPIGEKCPPLGKHKLLSAEAVAEFLSTVILA